MAENQGFDIVINGVPRTRRDDKAIALDAARNLKLSKLGDEVTVIDRATGEWLILTAPFTTELIWRPAPGVAGVEIT